MICKGSRSTKVCWIGKPVKKAPTSSIKDSHLWRLSAHLDSNCSHELIIISRLLLLFKNHFNIPVSRSDCDSCSSQANCAANNHRPNDFGNTHFKFHIGQQLQSHYRARKRTYKCSLPPPFVILLTEQIKGSNQAHLCNHNKEDSSHEATQYDLPRCSLLNERTVAKDGQSRRSRTNYEHWPGLQPVLAWDLSRYSIELDWLMLSCACECVHRAHCAPKQIKREHYQGKAIPRSTLTRQF